MIFIVNFFFDTDELSHYSGMRAAQKIKKKETPKEVSGYCRPGSKTNQ